MRQHGIIHPEMMERLRPNFYPSLCTIQQRTDTADSYGQPLPDWSNLAGHVNLPCRIAPKSTQERRTSEQIYVTATHHIALGGHYPAVTEKMQAIVDGTTYDIEGVEWDGNVKTTRIYVRLVK